VAIDKVVAQRACDKLNEGRIKGKKVKVRLLDN
jgi:hypothetical protein